LATNKVTVSARSYRPPEIEIYNFEIQNLESADQASSLAKDIRETTGEKTLFELDAKTNTWKIRIGEARNSIEEAGEFKSVLEEKGVVDVTIVTDKFVKPSDEAVKLSNQIAKNPASNIRSLGAGRERVVDSNPNKVAPTVSVASTDDVNVNANLREVIVSGASADAKFSSLKPVSFGSFNERSTPVKLNGKSYRGKIEVFVNSKGTLTVVNVVPMEDYLLGVVPAELSLPSLEAQKAQAVAARTYAVANVNGYASQGFDMLPTVWSQVYKGVSAETGTGTQAVLQTKGIVATYKGKPINALYTSTCGGRTENSENIFEFNEPYLRGVECSLEGHRHFEPFLIKTSRLPAKIEKDENLELVRTISQLAVNNFYLSIAQLDDKWFAEEPNTNEISNWLNNLAGRFGKTFPNVTKDTAKPIELAKVLASWIYADTYADTILSESDINYQLAFTDANEIPKERRADIAILMRDGWFSIYPDLTMKPNKPLSRARFLKLINQIYEKKKWSPVMQSATARPSDDGKLILKSGKSERAIVVRPDVFLFRQFGKDFYQMKETAMIGGENVRFQTDASGAVFYLEISPSDEPTVAEKMSPFTMWSANLTASAVQSRLSRYVRGIGTLIDVNIKQKGYSRRPTELEIIGTNGVKSLKGGKIRSALRLKEQLFFMNKRYGAGGRVVSYSFTGRGWGHGVGMCQYGAFGLGKMGLKYDAILKHYYTGIDLTKAY
jgi:stage II sporulation protein D